jgi:hypothetical protein
LAVSGREGNDPYLLVLGKERLIQPLARISLSPIEISEVLNCKPSPGRWLFSYEIEYSRS